MAIAVAPSFISTLTFAQRVGVAQGDRGGFSNPVVGPAATATSAPQTVRPLVKVGSVVVQPGENTTVPLGGHFTVWYDTASHTLWADILDSNIGGPA